MALESCFLGAAGSMSGAYGVYRLCVPTALTATPGIVATGPIGTAELRAVCGGIHAAMGVSFHHLPMRQIGGETNAKGGDWPKRWRVGRLRIASAVRARLPLGWPCRPPERRYLQ